MRNGLHPVLLLTLCQAVDKVTVRGMTPTVSCSEQDKMSTTGNRIRSTVAMEMALYWSANTLMQAVYR